MHDIKNPSILKLFANFYIGRKFDDFDELADNLRLWNIQISQLQAGRFTSSFTQLSVGKVSLAHGVFKGKTHQIGESPPGNTIVFHSGKNSQLTWRGQEVPQNGVMLFPEKTDLNAGTKGGKNNVYTVSIPVNSLQALLGDRSNGQDFGHIRSKKLIKARFEDVVALRNIVQSYFQLVDNQPGLLASFQFQYCFEDEISSIVAKVLSNGISSSQPKTTKTKKQIWKKIEKTIEQSSDSILYVSDLCRVAEISESTLLRLFHERFGISPKKYLIRYRLNGVRRHLKNALSQNTKINDIANCWGFWHMGQFAADYKSVFGELPSETLHR